MITGEKGYKWNNATQGTIGQIVKVSAADTLDQTTAITDRPYAVLLNQPKNGETAQPDGLNNGQHIGAVLADGSGTAIAVGDLLKTNATGRAVKATRAGAFVTTEAWIIGWALEACSAADKIIQFTKQRVEGSYS